jgi:hypothetical protein
MPNERLSLSAGPLRHPINHSPPCRSNTAVNPPLDDQPCVTTICQVATHLEVAVGSFAAANGNVRSTTGCNPCMPIARFIASKSARLPTLTEAKGDAAACQRKGLSPAPDDDRLEPIRFHVRQQPRPSATSRSSPARRFPCRGNLSALRAFASQSLQGREGEEIKPQ